MSAGRTAQRLRTVRGPGRTSLRVSPRACAAVGGLTLAALAMGVLALGTGAYPLSPPEVLRTLAGHGPAGADFIVNGLRLPRVTDGLLVGAALGLSGALFQSLTRNPLGSPDIVGLSQGSATGALTVILLLGGGTVATAAGAVLGGLATALAVYLLAWREGVSGLRLVLVGIGVSALLAAVNGYLLSRAGVNEATEALTWIVGSLADRGWGDVAVVGTGLLLLAPPALVYGRALAVLELGDDTAAALGVAADRTRFVLLAAGTGLTALAVAAAGPIPFVALAAPHLARRLSRRPGPGLVASACSGALLTVAADWLAQRIVPNAALPVGVVAAVLGGLYLTASLLTRRPR
ncbi:FecCD family ABC transporter permease [Streptacidiphilus cavernicola]|uniref:FecCD family ABC transporter permease n=1 Tax=Streptacidiphilus cavernicola TaxID=3342716 RepID=A0ABV6W4K2_9ACTN